jgi:hypothetical protein
MSRCISRRLERLVARVAAASKSKFFSARILLAHPEDGFAGVLLLESAKPTTDVPATPEDVEKVRADLERCRAARLSWNGGAN